MCYIWDHKCLLYRQVIFYSVLGVFFIGGSTAQHTVIHSAYNVST